MLFHSLKQEKQLHMLRHPQPLTRSFRAKSSSYLTLQKIHYATFHILEERQWHWVISSNAMAISLLIRLQRSTCPTFWRERFRKSLETIQISMVQISLIGSSEVLEQTLWFTHKRTLELRQHLLKEGVTMQRPQLMPQLRVNWMAREPKNWEKQHLLAILIPQPAS